MTKFNVRIRFKILRALRRITEGGNLRLWFLLLVILVVTIGCRGRVRVVPEEEIGQDNNIQQIHQVLDNFIKAHETFNISLLRETLWEESSFYPALVENSRRNFIRYSEIDIELTEVKIEFYSQGKRAAVTLRKKLQRKERDTGIVRKYTDWNFVEFIKAESEWVIVSWHWGTPVPEVP